MKFNCYNGFTRPKIWKSDQPSSAPPPRGVSIGTTYKKLVARWRRGDSDSQPKGRGFESSSGQCVYKMFVCAFSIYCVNTFEPQPIEAEVTDKYTICYQYQKALVGWAPVEGSDRLNSGLWNTWLAKLIWKSPIDSAESNGKLLYECSQIIPQVIIIESKQLNQYSVLA